MKKIFIIILTTTLYFSLNAQELMKIGDVFNFNIGDEFQFTTTGTTVSGGNIPPNAERISIIGKYYSTGQDTLFFIQYHNSYSSELVFEGEPHLEYHFWTKTDTVLYSNLDSSIFYYDAGFQLNQYIIHSSELCDSLVNGCSYSVGPGFENDNIINEYGNGLGHSYSYFYSGQGHYYTHHKLFYYKKGDISCGSPDLTTVGIVEPLKEIADFYIYPNPIKSIINLQNESSQDNFQCSLLNPMGQSIMTMELRGKTNRINVNHLSRGTYYLNIKTDKKTTTLKLIKE